MSTRFQEYINSRLVNHKIISLPERNMIEAIDRFGITAEAKLIYVDEDKFELYKAKINNDANPSRFYFEGVGDEIPHKLKEILSLDNKLTLQLDSLFAEPHKVEHIIYDPYFGKYLDIDNLLRKVGSEIDNLGLKNDDLIILVASSYTNQLLRYAFQQKVAKSLYLDAKDEVFNTKGRIEIKRSLSSSSVGVSAPMDTILGLMLNKNNIYVPLSDTTLDSSFYNNMNWRNLLGNFANISDTDVIVNDVHCRLIKLTPFIDAFGNIFINTYSVLDNHGSNMIVEGPALNMPESVLQPISKRYKTENVNKNPDSEGIYKPRVQRQDIIQNKNSRLKIKREGSFHQNTSIDDEIVLFDKSSYQWKIIEQRLPEMQISEINSNIVRLNAVFEAIYTCDRIVTDTNLWMTEYPVGSHQMAYLKLIEFITNHFVDGHNQVFDIVPEVYEEINKHDKDNIAASHKAKNIIAKYQAKDLVDLSGLTFEQNPNAYADITIGEHIMDLLAHDANFAILTNDGDAKIRWAQNIKDEINKKKDRRMPPIMLCRDLQKLFEMRGKLIKRNKELKSSSK